MWNLLQVSDVLDIEFASALSERVPVVAWEPARQYLPAFRSGSHAPQRMLTDPPLLVKTFSLQRGYARFPLSALPATHKAIANQLLRDTPDPENSPLICTVPYFAPVAEQWPGPVIYWLTDRIERYTGVNAGAIHRLDRRMCAAATLVCPNSQRLAEYLLIEAQCSPAKIAVLPNATRLCNVLPEPPSGPLPLPPDAADLPRPFAGVIGNLAGNLDWLLLERMMQLVPDLHWLLVGPTSMAIPEADQRAARERVMQSSRARFVGKKSYGELAAYARTCDVAVLPYRLCEPTYSGSSTRFYEHLAACRPMISTRGFEELLHKEPLLRLVDTAEEAAVCLDDLKQKNFDDDLAELRWRASRTGTWQERAATMIGELARRLPAPLARVS